MFGKILAYLNWVDVLIGLIYLRALYIGLKKGLIVELFKTVGMVFTIFIALHYYVVTAVKLNVNFAAPIKVGEILALLVFWLLIKIVFKFLREGFIIIFKAEPHPGVNKVGGAFLAFLRGSLISSFILFLFFVTGNNYLIQKANESYFGRPVQALSARIYGDIFDGFFNKLFPDEKKNLKAYQLGVKNGAQKKQ